MPHPATRPLAGLAPLALGLSACAGGPTLRGGRPPAAPAKAEVSPASGPAVVATKAPSVADPGASAAGDAGATAPALRLPSRLGLALPASLVGAQASARLKCGEGELVSATDGQLCWPWRTGASCRTTAAGWLGTTAAG